MMGNDSFSQAAWQGGARTRAFTFGAAMVLALLFGLLLTAKPAYATTFTVNTTASDNDGSCQQPVLRNPFRDCTLREAINAANSNKNGSTVVDIITFNIPGSGVRTISPTSPLPPITDALIINGYSQPGAKANTLPAGNDAVPLIELNGINAGQTSSGLLIQAPNSVVKGLVINRFAQVGIGIATSLRGEEATGNRIEGNFIGTDPSGTRDRGNRFGGVLIDGFFGDLDTTDSNVVGGTTPAARNVISGNDSGFGGVSISDGSTGNRIQGNYIGTDKTGTSALGNAGSGVRVRGADNNTVGGIISRVANTIAFNAPDGVTISIDSTGNRVQGNPVFSNTGLGIDLEGGTEDAAGRTANDPDDTDLGPNFLQNFPLLVSATTSSLGTTTVTGVLNSTPNTSFELEFFANPSGTDQGKNSLGKKTVSTDANGNVTFAFVPSKAVPAGRSITATATDPLGNTSEFSRDRQVRAS